MGADHPLDASAIDGPINNPTITPATAIGRQNPTGFPLSAPAPPAPSAGTRSPSHTERLRPVARTDANIRPDIHRLITPRSRPEPSIRARTPIVRIRRLMMADLLLRTSVGGTQPGGEFQPVDWSPQRPITLLLRAATNNRRKRPSGPVVCPPSCGVNAHRPTRPRSPELSFRGASDSWHAPGEAVVRILWTRLLSLSNSAASPAGGPRLPLSPAKRQSEIDDPADCRAVFGPSTGPVCRCLLEIDGPANVGRCWYRP